MNRFARRAAGVVAIGATIVAGVATPAYAGTDTQVTNDTGLAKFYNEGEWLAVYDYSGDGWATRAQLEVYHSPSGTWQAIDPVCFDDQSTGGTDERVMCNYSIVDGSQVRIHIWSSHNGATKNHKHSPVAVA